MDAPHGAMSPSGAVQRYLDQTRQELPANIKVALGCTGAMAAWFLLCIPFSFVMLAGPGEGSGMLMIGALILVIEALLIALFIGLRRRTAWAWYVGIVVYGIVCLGCIAGAIASLLQPAGDTSFFASGGAAIAMIVFAAAAALPIWMLVSTRRRYFDRHGP